MADSPTQLLCTFVTTETLDHIVHQIIENYDCAFDTIYVLENVSNPSALCCTYNIHISSSIGPNIPEATISLHRKKATNTLYTINALNAIVAELNGGKLDKGFQIPWHNYRNTILVTAFNKLKRIDTNLVRIIKINEYLKQDE
jgi:hypothetical protein